MKINSLEYWVWRVSPAGWERRELLILSARWLIYDEPSVCSGGAPPSATWHPMWVRKCVVDGEHRATANNPQYSEHILRDSPELRLWLRCLRWRLGITRDNYSDQDNTQHNPRKTRDSHALSMYPSGSFPQHTRKYKSLIRQRFCQSFLWLVLCTFMLIKLRISGNI